MPTISSSSAIRTSNGHFSLALRARHFLVVGTASENARSIKARLPADVDVILASDLVIALSGVVDSVKIPGHVIQQSAVARHILEHLRVNAGQLGISLASNIYVDQEDGRAKFSLSSSRPLRAGTEMACLRLVSIDVELVCKTSSRGESNSSEAASLFSGQAYLPLFSALDGVMDKFVSNDLARKYPLIFGPWREKLDAEARLYPSLSCSLLNIAKSSNDPSVKRRLRRVMTAFKSQRTSHITRTMQSLHHLLGDDEGGQEITAMDDSTLVSYSLESLYRRGVRPAVFKARSRTAKTALEDEDEDTQMFDLSAHPLRCLPSNIMEDLDNERTMDFSASSDDDAWLELADDQRESDLWSPPGFITFTAAAEEDYLESIDLWDEDAAGYESSASESLFCDATFSSSQSTLLDPLGSDEEACRMSLYPITAPRSSQQSSEPNYEVTAVYETGLSAWSPPDLFHQRHNAQATNAEEPLHTDRDVLLDSDDDGFFSGDAMTATRTSSRDQSPPTGRFGCKGFNLMALDGDDRMYDDASDYLLLDEQDTKDTLNQCLESAYGLELPHLSSCDITISELGNGDLYDPGILSDGE